MMATKMIRESEVVDEIEAPSAIPSAAACMQRPKVVEKEREGGGGADVAVEDSSDREYIFGIVCGRLWEGLEIEERLSSRYIRMNPNIRDSPIQTWGVRSEGGTEVVDVFSTMCTSLADVGVEGGGKPLMAETEASAFEGNASEAIVPDGITGPGRSSPVREGLLLRASGNERKPCGRESTSLRAWAELEVSLAL